MVIYWPVDAKCHVLEPPETEYDCKGAYTEDDGFCTEAESLGGEYEVIQEMPEHEDREVECGELRAEMRTKRGTKPKHTYVVVHVSYAVHDEEWY